MNPTPIRTLDGGDGARCGGWTGETIRSHFSPLSLIPLSCRVRTYPCKPSRHEPAPSALPRMGQTGYTPVHVHGRVLERRKPMMRPRYDEVPLNRPAERQYQA
jgi:hypothetical protein